MQRKKFHSQKHWGNVKSSQSLHPVVMGVSNPREGYNVNQSSHFLFTYLAFQKQQTLGNTSGGKKQEPLMVSEEESGMVQLVYGKDMEDKVNRKRVGS